MSCFMHVRMCTIFMLKLHISQSKHSSAFLFCFFSWSHLAIEAGHVVISQWVATVANFYLWFYRVHSLTTMHARYRYIGTELDLINPAYLVDWYCLSNTTNYTFKVTSNSLHQEMTHFTIQGQMASSQTNWQMHRQTHTHMHACTYNVMLVIKVVTLLS